MYMDDFEDPTLVTNMGNEEKELIIKAITLNKLEDVLTVQNAAIVLGGKRDHSMFSLHTKIDTYTNLASFWGTFQQLKQKENKGDKVNVTTY